MNYRIGHGYDVHKLQKGRELILGGVHIENGGIGLLGHSDADVLAHAVCDALLGAAALGDIGKHRHKVGQLSAGFIVYGRNGQKLRINLAVLVAVPDFTAPVAGFLDAFPHGLVKGGIVPARLEYARIAADDFTAFPAGNAAEGRIDVKNIASGISQRDAVMGIAECRGMQLELFFGC